MGNLKTALEGISIAGGYNNDIASVQRWSQHEQDFTAVPLIVFVAGRESREDSPNPYTTAVLTVEGMLYVSQDPGSGVSTDTFLNTFYEDIVRALKADVTRGGFAVDTRITDIEPFETAEDEPYAGLVFEIEVKYQHLENDPTQTG
jgi:hypothetical protein